MRPCLPLLAFLTLLSAPGFGAEAPAAGQDGVSVPAAASPAPPPNAELAPGMTLEGLPPAPTAATATPPSSAEAPSLAAAQAPATIVDTKEMTALKVKAQQGDATAAYQLGLAYIHTQKVAGYAAAEKWWVPAAQGGNTDAQLELGNLYAHVSGYAYAYVNGQGVPLNYDAAFKWYRLAADHGNSKAAYALADMFDAGWGMHPDPDTAAIWRKKGDDMAAVELKSSAQSERGAAERGEPKAQYDIGQSYYTGQGVPKSTPEALKWFRLSANQGYANAEKMLGLIYCDTTEPTQNYPEALEWYKKAAAQGMPDADYWVGLLYELGKTGVTQDYIEAAKWYRKAADHGYVQAQFALGYLYYVGQNNDRVASVPVNYVEAYFWMSLARLNRDMFESLTDIKKAALIDAAKHLTPEQKDAVKQRLLAWTPTLPVLTK